MCVCTGRWVLAPAAGHHASCTMVKPQQLLMGLKLVCQSWAPAPFSLKLFVPGTLLEMQELLQSCILRHGLERRLLCVFLHLSCFSMPGVSRRSTDWGPVSPPFPYIRVACGERVVLSFKIFSFHPSFLFNHLYPPNSSGCWWSEKRPFCRRLGQFIFGPEMRKCRRSLSDSKGFHS